MSEIKMYTKADVIRLLADERTRSVHFCNQLIEKLGREMNSNPPIGTLNGISRARSIINGLFFTLLGSTTMSKEKTFESQLLELIEKDYFSAETDTPRQTLDCTVYPSDEKTISVVGDDYGGAHCYCVRESKGFADGKAEYVDTEQVIQFVHKTDDGTVVPGLQSEQLVQVLLDRHSKLNAKYPSEQYAKMKKGLTMFLNACKERIDDRIERGVMGELKK